MNRYLAGTAFAAGLGAIGWVAQGYFGAHALALTITLLIAGFYLVGAAELYRFRQATSGLGAALQALTATPAALGDWLSDVPPSLRHAVRLRVEGERVALPGPAMTPYLVGLLVLLGMLGTFLGMVVTLGGAVQALQSTTDLATIRAALAAPIEGLGLAFGTSIAGVAASAMLGLVSALCRRDRLQLAQLLDARVASHLRVFSRAHQREQTLELLQQQTRALPDLVAQMQVLAAQLQQQAESLGERLLAGQDRFHQHAQSAYAELAASVDQSLRHSLGEGARLAGAALGPLVETTMAGITRETAAFQQQMSDAVQLQLDGLAGRLDATVGTVSDAWAGALARHDSRSEALAAHLQQSLAGFNDGFEQRAASLLAAVDARQAQAQQAWSGSIDAMAQRSATAHAQLAQSAQDRLDAAAARFDATAGTAAQSWRDALALQQQGDAARAGAMQAAVAALVDGFAQRSDALLETVGQSHARLQTELADADRQRLAAWSASLDALASGLRDEAQRAGARSLAQQEQICRTLEDTAHAIQTQAAAQAHDTIAEMGRLIATVSEAPRAAAQVVDALRDKLSDSLARDNDMLAERSRIMGTLATLLDAVNQASAEQRGAIDALVAASGTMLERTGAQFGERIGQAADKLEGIAAQAAGSSIDMASMGEAFGVAVQQFGASSEALTAHLQRIEAALDKSSARSDEQLAYYVAQAREIVDLSISSQKQIVDDLQQLAGRQRALAGEAAG
jgi:hypothetical protein